MQHPPHLIALRHLDGFHVWRGNELRGAVWQDRSGWRWSERWTPPAVFRRGTCETLEQSVEELG